MTTDRELADATSSIRTRARSDFKRLIRAHRFSLFAGTMAALGAGAGALAPSDTSGFGRFLIATFAALGALVLTYLIALLWSLLRAPFRQRSELIASLARSEDSPQPLMRMEATIEMRTVKPMMEPSHRLSVAFVRVYNAQELGGDEATAKHVTPEVKVFAPGDVLVFHHKGWDKMAWREFTTSQEEHALWLVAKRQDSDGCFLIQKEDAAPVKHLNDDAYVAEITLRGFLPNGPISKRFVFSSRGSGTDLSFEEEKSGAVGR